MEELSKRRQYSKWTAAEKAMLVELVRYQKTQTKRISWTEVATSLSSKSPRQCYDQWLAIRRSEGAKQPAASKETVASQQKMEVLLSSLIEIFKQPEPNSRGETKKE